MNIVAEGKRVRAYFSEQDKHHGTSLWAALLDFLRAEGATGATVFRGIASFGAHSRIHTATLVDLASPLPLVLEWIDTTERVERLLPRICELVAEGIVTVEHVEIAKYAHRATAAVPSGLQVADV